MHLHFFNFLYRVRDLCPHWSTRRRASFSCATLYKQLTKFIYGIRTFKNNVKLYCELYLKKNSIICNWKGNGIQNILTSICTSDIVNTGIRSEFKTLCRLVKHLKRNTAINYTSYYDLGCILTHYS